MIRTHAVFNIRKCKRRIRPTKALLTFFKFYIPGMSLSIDLNDLGEKNLVMYKNVAHNEYTSSLNHVRLSTTDIQLSTRHARVL